MSTAPTIIQSELSALAHKQLTITYSVLAVLVLVLSLACVGGFFGLKAYEAQVARAEAQEARYDSDRKLFAAELAQHDAQRAQDAQDEAKLIAQIASRDKAAPPPVIQTGLKPNATAAQAAAALGALISSPDNITQLSLTSDQKVALEVPEAQKAALLILNGNRSQADLADQTQVLTLVKKDNDSLKTDLNACRSTLSTANTTIESYKKISVKTKWQKILAGAKIAGMMLASAAIGHVL